MEKRLCWKCFRTGHVSSGCDAVSQCLTCRGRHHTLMCDPNGFPPNRQFIGSAAPARTGPKSFAAAVAPQIPSLAPPLASSGVPIVPTS